MPQDRDPSHDRIRLSSAERQTITQMERALDREQRFAVRLTSEGWGMALVVGRALVRLSLWLLPLTVVITLALIGVSTLAGAIGALVTSMLLVTVIHRAILRSSRSESMDDVSRRTRS